MNSQPGRSTPRLTLWIGALWLTLVVAATGFMLNYANTPSQKGSPPSAWPAASTVTRVPNLPTLVMFIHPRCPCSRASVGELALLMACSQGRVNAQVLFVKPPGEPADWTLTDTWREAAGIPGVNVRRDDDGREAHEFNIETSGDIVLYDPAGRIRFHGGITASRGHSGDNAGRDALFALLHDQPALIDQTPVFGCSLLDCEAPTNR